MKDITWRVSLDDALQENGEAWSDIVSSTLTEAELDRECDSDLEISDDQPFTVWTHNTVYFPMNYYGWHMVAQVSRNPDGKPTNPIGGGNPTPIEGE